MKTTIQILFLLLIAAACRKPGNQNVVTIEGQLMSGCNTPAAHQAFIFIEKDYDHSLFSSDVWIDFVTDQNGYFKVKTKKNVNLNLVEKTGFKRILENIEISQSGVNLDKIYINKFLSKLRVKLEVYNPYSQFDTLVIRDYNNYTNTNMVDYKYYSGPFVSGILDSFEFFHFNRFPIIFQDVLHHGGPSFFTLHRLRSLPNFDSGLIKTDFFLVKPCSGEYTELTLVIN
jgi:hypothetical protein